MTPPSSTFKTAAIPKPKGSDVTVTTTGKKKLSKCNLNLQFLPSILTLKEGQYVTKDPITGAFTVHERKMQPVKDSTTSIAPVRKKQIRPAGFVEDQFDWEEPKRKKDKGRNKLNNVNTCISEAWHNKPGKWRKPSRKINETKDPENEFRLNGPTCPSCL